MITIENDILSVRIKNKGAELNSVFNRRTQLEYMWCGDPAVWGKTSPILFPVVGTLKDDTFVYHDKAYLLTRHGFARDFVFEVTDQQTAAVTFLLRSSEEILRKYPFHFELRVRYHLENDHLFVTYEVLNNGDASMYFSLGAHPAFKVPLVANSNYEDYYLSFNHVESFDRWPISNAGLIETKSVHLGVSDKILLTKSLFLQDALVFKKLKSTQISLQSKIHSHGLSLDFTGFPYMGIWAAPNADFVCIEPWCGIADRVDHNQQFVNKEGIEKLLPGGVWTREWHAQFY